MKTTKFQESEITDLKNQLCGNVILPDNPEYDNARKVYNAMIDKHPGIIIKCNDVADVIAAVKFGRKNNLLVAVRGGGHNGGGLGICDDGLVIDLSGIRYVKVDPKTKTVLVGGGNTLAEVDHATHAFRACNSRRNDFHNRRWRFDPWRRCWLSFSPFWLNYR